MNGSNANNFEKRLKKIETHTHTQTQPPVVPMYMNAICEFESREIPLLLANGRGRQMMKMLNLHVDIPKSIYTLNITQISQ